MSKTAALIKADILNIKRDPLIVILPVVPIIAAVFLKLLLPVIRNYLLNEFVYTKGFDLAEYYQLIACFIAMMPAILYTMITGFMILDERDEHLIDLFSITPLGKKGYLSYRLLSPVLISFVLTLIVLLIFGNVSLPWYGYLFTMFISAQETPIIALIMGAFSANKIEGMAVAKGLGIIYIAPVAVYFVNSKLQYLAGIAPPFWVMKVFQAAVERNLAMTVIFACIGTLIHIIIIYILLIIFIKKIEK